MVKYASSKLDLSPLRSTMSMTTLITLGILLGIFAISHGSESEQLEAFIKDIIETWQLRSPTIIVNDDFPNMCMTHQWLLCLSNRDTNEVTNHLASIHQHRKQDGLIFIGFQGHEKLLQQLPASESTILKSNHPVFMPLAYQNEIQLRLDSNIIFYRKINITNFELHDVFAVKGGPSIKVDIGKWNYENGFILTKSMNRWERRTDLQGTRFLNCFALNPPSAEFIKDKNGNIIGSKGSFQDRLFYITDRLNLTIETIEAQWVNKLLDNGSWTGQIGFLQRQEADVVTTNLGINSQRSTVIDFPMQIILSKFALCAIISTKGVSPNMWVYVNVFGFNQWMIFIILLILIVIGLTVIHTLSDDQSGREFGTKRGSSKNYRLDSASSALAMVFLFTVQMGSHTNSKQLAPRLLTLTMSILTLLFFVFYAGDITAKMTSGPPEIPIRTFEDVVYYNYEVVTKSSYFERLLSTFKPGSAKREVYDNHFEMKKDLDEVVSEMINIPKTLYFGMIGHLRKNWKKYHSAETHKAIELKMDDAVFSNSGLGLQKDSEFSPLFNHFILKGYENGVFSSINQAYQLDPEENFEIMEPQPLGLNNVMFCFITLGIGICVSISNVMIELIIRKTSKKQIVVKTMVKTNERKDARWATGRDINEVK